MTQLQWYIVHSRELELFVLLRYLDVDLLFDIDFELTFRSLLWEGYQIT